jgi:membrane-anchored protein YejM (alkaline phosphatase superfamily)
VPDLLDISKESDATKELYGLNDKLTEDFGRECLMARRLVERGVRFIELLTPSRPGLDRWDQHANLDKGHRINAQSTDKPIAGLLKDLKSRGLLDSTLVVWGGEFGRTPCAQMGENGFDSNTGRDHNPYGFTMWMAGGGAKPGTVYGATDDFGYFAVENKVHVHDLHATMLHLLGIDHKRLTYRYSGRDMRLTDVHGNVIKALIT